MEIEVNKEIQMYRKQIFFGLSVRQCVCALGAVGFGLRSLLGRGGGTVSWLCIICAASLALAGFFEYQGLTLEQYIWARARTHFICGGKRVYQSVNYYDLLLQEERTAEARRRKPAAKGKQKGDM